MPLKCAPEMLIMRLPLIMESPLREIRDKEIRKIAEECSNYLAEVCGVMRYSKVLNKRQNYLNKRSIF